MPYIETYRKKADIRPKEGEDFATFMARVVPAMLELDPSLTPDCANAQAENNWNTCVLDQAEEITLTLKRDFYEDTYGIYQESWYGDWQITEVHSAKAMHTGVELASVEKARAGTGDSYRIAKSVDEKQLVFGWANIAKEADGSYPLDWDGDVTKPEDLEAAAYSFVLKYRETGTDHQGEAVGKLVESVMFTKEKMDALGIPEGVLPEGWWTGFYIEDAEVFKKVKSGEYQMFSVQGNAVRVPTGQE